MSHHQDDKMLKEHDDGLDIFMLTHDHLEVSVALEHHDGLRLPAPANAYARACTCVRLRLPVRTQAQASVRQCTDAHS